MCNNFVNSRAKIWICFFIVAALCTTCLYAQTGRLTILLHHFVGAQELKLDTVQYFNGLGQSFNVTKFKYYFGNIQLQRSHQTEYKLSSYYLVDEEESESKRIVIEDIPAGDYTGMCFIVGVDSAENCSGAQSGALDPINGMFWTWNTGYIFLKLEGKSPASKSASNMLEYHIGGYREPNNCIRTANLTFEKPLKIQSGATTLLDIKVDVAKILSGKEVFDFSKLSSVTDFHNATRVANNYIDMFSVMNIEK